MTVSLLMLFGIFGMTMAVIAWLPRKDPLTHASSLALLRDLHPEDASLALDAQEKLSSNRIEKFLEGSQLSLSPMGFILVLLVVALLGFFVGNFFLENAVASFLMGLLAMAIPVLWIDMRKKKFARLLDQDLSQILNAMSTMVGAGATLLPAFSAMAKSPRLSARLRPAWMTMLADIESGEKMEEALWKMAKKLGTPGVLFFVQSIDLLREPGGKLSVAMRDVAHQVEASIRHRAAVQAGLSQISTTLYMTGSLVFAVYGFSMLTNPNYEGQLLHTSWGPWFIGGTLLFSLLGTIMTSRSIKKI